MVVVLHVTDDAHVSSGVLAEAEQQATRVYHAAGVRAVWTDGAAVLEELPDLEPADVSACLRFASRRLDHPIVAA